jgi:hypothetical protein
MNIIDIMSENRLGTTSVVLGILAIVFFFLLQGTVNTYLYLGIPAIVTGALSLFQNKRKHIQLHPASLVLPIAGIVLGTLPIIFAILALA